MASSAAAPTQPTASSSSGQAAGGQPPSGSGPPEPRSDRAQVTAGGNQHYSLRWNNHQSHVLSAFESLLQNESLVDCTLVCEDTSIRAHKVVLSACSPYFQKIFVDNPCKHPIIVLKDIRGWEVQCIVDFMYKGETSVPEAQLTSLIKAAESLKVRGLTSSDQRNSHLETRSRSPMPPMHPMNGYHHGHPPPPSHHSLPHRGYSPSPARSAAGYMDHQEPSAKIQHMSHSNQSSPMSLTNHQDDRDRHSANGANRASPGPAGSGPRRKQARPRRRSGDSIGNASLDLSKSDSPPLSSLSGASNNNGFGGGNRTKNSSPSSSTMTQQHVDETPENLGLKGPSSSPGINLVKTEHLMEESRSRDHSRGHLERAHSSDPHLRQPHHLPPHRDDIKPPPSSPFMAAAAAVSGDKPLYASPLHHNLQEHEARAEALQALNFMAAGGGLPPHFPGHPLAHPPHVQNPHLTPSSLASLAAAGAAAAAVVGRPTSTPNTPSNAFPAVRGLKGQHSAPRGGPPRSWTNDELTKALGNVWNKRMTTSQASRVYGIPYNSLLMYVRGKYGKSLKLDKLKKNTPAAHDTLNTIGNSRSTPKEKLLAKANKIAVTAIQQAVKNKENETEATSPVPLKSPMEAFQDCGRMKELILDMQNQQAMLNQAERIKELEKHLPPEQAKLLIPIFERQCAEMAALAASGVSPPITDDMMVHSPATLASFGSGGAEEDMEEEEIGVDEAKEEEVSDKEQQVRDILIEAAAKRQRASTETLKDDTSDDEKKEESDSKDIITPPSAIPITNNEISAL